MEGEQRGHEDHGRSGDGLRFYPDYLLEILVVIVLVLEVVITLGLLSPAVLGRRIDLVGRFTPRPEWYFLWLYELVKYFPGRLIFVGTAVLPLGILTALIAVPWIDQDGRRRYVVRVLWFATLTLAGVLTCMAL